MTPTPIGTPTATATYDPGVGGDRYELDDRCDAARFTSADGGPQEHTFHKIGDVDWVTFAAIEDKLYRVEVVAGTDSPADVVLELYISCDTLPTERWFKSFTPGVRLDFTAPETGLIYLRLSNYAAEIAGNHVSYTLSVRQLAQDVGSRALIIVAGRLRGSDSLQNNIHNVTDQVYRLFQANGYNDADILYLATDSGLAGYDAAVTRDSLRNGITNWAVERLTGEGVFNLYMIDHGQPDKFYLDEVTGQRLNPDELHGWLAQLEAARPGVRVNVFIEACESGSFIEGAESISRNGRVVVTSTTATTDAKASRAGAYFSDHFLSGLYQGQNVLTSFVDARAVARSIFSLQDAWLDANGNRVPNELEDSAIAAQRSFAYANTLAGDEWAPHIFSVTGPEEIQAFQGTVRADVRDDVKVRLVWGVVYPPDYVPPATSEQLQAETLPTFLFNSVAGGDLYAGEYGGFSQHGVYRIVVHAEDNKGLVARPVEIFVEVGGQNYLPLLLK